MTIPADELRVAAATIRARAEAATDWFMERRFLANWRTMLEDWLGGPVGEHAATWSPVAAVAVAAWLEQTAWRHSAYPPRGPSDDDPQCRTCVGSLRYEEHATWPCPDMVAALAVACAITGATP